MAEIYNSEKLIYVVKRWVNSKKIKVKDYESKSPSFLKELKLLTEQLSKQKEFEFNRDSIFLILDQHFNIKA